MKKRLASGALACSLLFLAGCSCDQMLQGTGYALDSSYVLIEDYAYLGIDSLTAPDNMTMAEFRAANGRDLYTERQADVLRATVVEHGETIEEMINGPVNEQ